MFGPFFVNKGIQLSHKIIIVLIRVIGLTDILRDWLRILAILLGIGFRGEQWSLVGCFLLVWIHLQWHTIISILIGITITIMDRLNIIHLHHQNLYVSAFSIITIPKIFSISHIIFSWQWFIRRIVISNLGVCATT